MTTVEIAGRSVAIQNLREYYEGDPRRGNSFVTNFGNWQVPQEVAGPLGTQVGHLEWVHDTGELILIGAVPHVGLAESDESVAEGREAALLRMIPGSGAAPTGLGGSDGHGGVRLLFDSEIVPDGAQVALLGVVAHGPAAHELLWGWHRHHLTAEGWAWLAGRLQKLDATG